MRTLKLCGQYTQVWPSTRTLRLCGQYIHTSVVNNTMTSLYYMSVAECLCIYMNMEMVWTVAKCVAARYTLRNLILPLSKETSGSKEIFGWLVY